MGKVIAIIPAKGNSKGLPNKNMMINHHTGMNLIDYAITDALSANLETYVSTESPIIKDYVTNNYDSVGILDRPLELTLDCVQVDTVVYFSALQMIHAGKEFDAIIVLQPTSPLRGSVKNAVDYWNALETYGEFSLMSVESVDGFHYTWDKETSIKPVAHDPAIRVGRQDLDDYDLLLRETGAIYIASKKAILKHKTFRVEPIVPFFAGGDSLEIDSLEDWETFLGK